MKLDIYKIFKTIEIEEDDEFMISEYDEIMRVHKNFLESKDEDTDEWKITHVAFNELLNLEFEIVKRAPWKPELNDTVWIVTAELKTPVQYYYWQNNLTSKNLYSRGLVFETKKEAIEKAKELGWWEDNLT